MATITDVTAQKMFADKMMDFSHYGYVLVELILGYDLGLFKVFKNANAPLTSTEIAERADLKERYVREWLGAVSAAGVIVTHVQDSTCGYSLPAEHYDAVVSSVAFGRGVCACVKRIDFIKTCFMKHGPIGDSHAFEGEFTEFLGEYRNQTIGTMVEDELLPYIETVGCLHEDLRNGCKVLDIGCGSGTLTMAFARRYPKSSFTGLEVTEDALVKANTALKETKNAVPNLRFKHSSTGDLSAETEGTYGVVMLFQVLHILADPLKMIDELDRVLKPSGRIVLIEPSVHSNPADNAGDMRAATDYTFSQFFCLPFSLSGKPHIGYGEGWGKEAMLKALGKYFTLDATFTLANNEALFCLTNTTK